MRGGIVLVDPAKSRLAALFADIGFVAGCVDALCHQGWETTEPFWPAVRNFAARAFAAARSGSGPTRTR